MKPSSIQLEIDTELDFLLSRIVLNSSHSQKERIQHSLKRQLRLQFFEETRKEIQKLAQARGFTTDQDISDFL
jgi:hypothetical protein